MLRSVLKPHAIIRVQSWAGEALVPSVAADNLGVDWPKKTSTVASGHVDIICVGPTDWLVLAADPDATPWLRRLEALFQGGSFRATNVSQALARIEIEGPEVRDLLAKGCALDLHPSTFPPGCSTRTRFAGLPVVVCCVRHSTFELIVPLSYADYLMAWLEDAELEFVAIP